MDIRKILNILTEAEKPLFEGMKVMTLDQFLKSQGVEPKKSKEVDEAKLDVVPQRLVIVAKRDVKSAEKRLLVVAEDIEALEE